MKKVDKCSSAGTEVDSSTKADVSSVIQPIAKPNVGRSAVKQLSHDDVKRLMSTHIFNLSEEDVISLAFLIDVEISNFKKSDWKIDFKVSHRNSSVIVECGKNSNCSIGRSRREKNGCYGLTSWGGVFSFASALRIFRTFFCKGYELTLQSKEKLNVYTKEQWKELVLSANEIIEAA